MADRLKQMADLFKSFGDKNRLLIIKLLAYKSSIDELFKKAYGNCPMIMHAPNVNLIPGVTEKKI